MLQLWAPNQVGNSILKLLKFTSSAILDWLSFKGQIRSPFSPSNLWKLTFCSTLNASKVSLISKPSILIVVVFFFGNFLMLTPQKQIQNEKSFVDLPKCCCFSPRRKIDFGWSRNLSYFYRVNNQSLGAPRRDLWGQNWGQIWNLHKILYNISLSQLQGWTFKFRWYSLICLIWAMCTNLTAV